MSSTKEKESKELKLDKKKSEVKKKKTGDDKKSKEDKTLEIDEYVRKENLKQF
jgi:hypothetical protein